MAFMILMLLFRPLPRKHAEADTGHGFEAFWFPYIHRIHRMQYYMYCIYTEYYYNNTTMYYEERSCYYTIAYA
jgi:hypothetical protein